MDDYRVHLLVVEVVHDDAVLVTVVHVVEFDPILRPDLRLGLGHLVAGPLQTVRAGLPVRVQRIPWGDIDIR